MLLYVYMCVRCSVSIEISMKDNFYLSNKIFLASVALHDVMIIFFPLLQIFKKQPALPRFGIFFILVKYLLIIFRAESRILITFPVWAYEFFALLFSDKHTFFKTNILILILKCGYNFKKSEIRYQKIRA